MHLRNIAYCYCTLIAVCKYLLIMLINTLYNVHVWLSSLMLSLKWQYFVFEYSSLSLFHFLSYFFQQWVLVKYDPPQECISRPLRFHRFPLHFCVNTVVTEAFAYSHVQTASSYGFRTRPMWWIQMIVFGQRGRSSNHSDYRFFTRDMSSELFDQEVRNS